MVEYAQIECSRCFGIFPGNVMRSSSRSVEVGRTVQDSNPFDVDSVMHSLKTAKTHYGTSEVILCPNCRSKIRSGKFIKLVLFIAVVGAALYFYLDKSSFRLTDVQSEAVSPDSVAADGTDQEVAEPMAFDATDDLAKEPVPETDDATTRDVVDAMPTDEYLTSNLPAAAISYVLTSVVNPPVPRGNPGNWANTNDYPRDALQDGREGRTTFTVAIDERGRVTTCRIVESSGSADLDDATCSNVQKRARFEPATDADGNAVQSAYTNTVRWQIPS